MLFTRLFLNRSIQLIWSCCFVQVNKKKARCYRYVRDMKKKQTFGFHPWSLHHNCWRLLFGNHKLRAGVCWGAVERLNRSWYKSWQLLAASVVTHLLRSGCFTERPQFRSWEGREGLENRRREKLKQVKEGQRSWWIKTTLQAFYSHAFLREVRVTGGGSLGCSRAAQKWCRAIK